MSDPLATPADLGKAWRPIRSGEEERATYWLGAASRRIRRRWPDVDDRITAGSLDTEDVKDVVIALAKRALTAAEVPGAKSWSSTAGPYSNSVTLEAAVNDLLAFEDWMVEVFAGGTAPKPVFSMPPSGRYEGLFVWPEGRGS